MLKLIIWLAAVLLCYRIWKGLRVNRNGTPRVRDRAGEGKRPRFDRSQIVDAEFKEIDEEGKGA